MSTMQLLIDVIKEQNPSSTISADDTSKTLEDLGLDSLDIATVIMEFGTRIDGKIDDENINGDSTLGEFVALVGKLE